MFSTLCVCNLKLGPQNFLNDSQINEPVVYAKLGSAYARLGLALDLHDTAGATKE